MAPNGPRSLSNFTIGTFNVRGLSSATKRDQLSEDLNKRHIDVCCIQEPKCPGGFDVVSGYYRLIGLPSTSRHYGLAFAVASLESTHVVSGTQMAHCLLVFLKRTACLLATPPFNMLHVTKPLGKVNTEMRRTGPLYPSITLSTLSSAAYPTKAY